MTPERAGELAEQAGMVNLFFHGAASMVFTHGVGGVTQEQLMKFANLCCAEERGACIKIAEEYAKNAGNMYARHSGRAVANRLRGAE